MGEILSIAVEDSGSKDGTTDRGRAYVVYDKGALAMLYVQGYGHMLPAPE